MPEPTAPYPSPPSRAESPPDLPQPLSGEELARAEQVAHRLTEELRAAIALLPPEDRGASAMSRALNLDRATCQRVVAAASRPDATPHTLVQLPGVEGLRKFIVALARRRGGRPNTEEVVAASAAIDSFESLLEQFDVSQRGLRARLDAPSRKPFLSLATGSGAEDAATREALFHTAATVTGRWSATVINTRIIAPTGNPALTDGLILRGLIGHHARPDAVPLETGESMPAGRPEPAGPVISTLTATPATGETPASLLHDFCSSPLPRVISRSAGARVIHQIDSPIPGAPLDLVMAHRFTKPEPHPATQQPPLGEIWFLVTFPSQRLIFDVFLHRDIARRCIPSLGMHLWGPDVLRHGSSRWSTRFPGGPRLEVLGPGLEAVATPAYARYPQLLDHVFKDVGWDSGDFTGYRCELLYPVWRAGYCMLFDFAGNEIPAGPQSP